jgi:hypothetical protein
VAASHRHLARAGRWLAFAAALVAGARCEHISRDELRCEEAVAHVRGCCPGIDLGAVQCQLAGQGCGGAAVPTWDCLIDLSCDQIQQRGVCAATPSSAPQVCP